MLTDEQLEELEAAARARLAEGGGEGGGEGEGEGEGEGGSRPGVLAGMEPQAGAAVNAT